MLRLLTVACVASVLVAKRLHASSSINWSTARADGSVQAEPVKHTNLLKTGSSWTPFAVHEVPPGAAKAEQGGGGLLGFRLLGAAFRLTLVLIVGIVLVYLLARSRSRPPPSPYVSKGLLSHLRCRLCCEWHIIRQRLLPEWLLIGVFLVYLCSHVIRTLLVARQREDYGVNVPQSWCTAIETSPDRPADWKDGDTCADHVGSLLNFGGLADAVQKLFPGAAQIKGLERSPEIVQGCIGILVSSVIIGGTLLREPGAHGNRPYLASILTRSLRVLTFTMAVHAMVSLATHLPIPRKECLGASAQMPEFHWWNLFGSGINDHDCAFFLYSWELPVLFVMVCAFFHYGEKLLEPETYLFHWGRILLTVMLIAQSLLVILIHGRYTSDLLVIAVVAIMSWRLYDHEAGEDATPHQFLEAHQEAASHPRESAQRERAAKLLSLTDEQFAQHVLFEGSVWGFVFLVLIALGFLTMTTATLVAVFAK